MTHPPNLAELSAIVGSPVIAAERCGWGFENRTDKATLADGRTLIVQRITNRGMAAHKIRLAQLLPERLAEVGLRAPQLLHADAHANPPYAVREWLPGEAGASLMGQIEGATWVAQAMGALLPQLARVPTQGLGLNTAWANPPRLAEQAQRQLVRCQSWISPSHAAQLTHSITQHEALFTNRPSVFAHGDFCPVNVLVGMRDEGWGMSKSSLIPHPSSLIPQLLALLDVEFARVADPLFDLAWWGWVVRFHHEERWRVAFPHLLAAAGVENNQETQARITTIQQLRLLEALDYNVALSPERGAMWADRLATTLNWQ